MVRRFLRQTDAVAAIEFAIIAPIVVVLLGAMLEFGMYFQVYSAVNRLASQYAISWSDCSDSPAGTCLTEAGNYTTSAAVRNLSPVLTSADVTVRLLQVRLTGSTIAVTYSSPSGATPTAAETAAINNKLTGGDAGVVATVTYVHHLVFFASIVSPWLGNKLTSTGRVVQLK